MVQIGVRMPHYTEEQKKIALGMLDECGSVTEATRRLGYPSRSVLYHWARNDDAAGRRAEGKIFSHYPAGIREEAIRLAEGGLGNSEVASRLGVSSPTVVYHWVRNARRGKQPMPKKPTPVIGAESASDGFEGDEVERIRRLELENDILRGVVDHLKVGCLERLTNREKTLIINSLRLRTECPLRELTAFLRISKSSYEYQRKALLRPDKYALARTRIQEIFDEHDARWGSERIWAELRREDGDTRPLVVSEKIVRRIMRQEDLKVVYCKKRRHYNSYGGEQGERPGNLVRRNFHADRPNVLWLTDITEFGLGQGKVYLSPIIDCFDGKVVSWSISQNPDAELVSTMLKDATSVLRKDERPILHSDGGVHYRWDCWVRRCDEAGITRSMSKKACSPDNSACEGFFGRLKNEFFYYRDWRNTAVKDFMTALDEWVRYYNEGRAKKSLGWLSPNQYRRSLGLAA